MNDFKVKIGDKLIANDEFNSFGYIEGEVIKITPYDKSIRLVNMPSNVEYGVTILAKIKSYDSFGGSSIRTREIETCNIKINPENTDINVDWGYYNTYCKAIFFTSKEEKKKFYQRQKENNMNYHLRMAKSYGYKE